MLNFGKGTTNIFVNFNNELISTFAKTSQKSFQILQSFLLCPVLDQTSNFSDWAENFYR